MPRGSIQYPNYMDPSEALIQGLNARNPAERFLEGRQKTLESERYQQMTPLELKKAELANIIQEAKAKYAEPYEKAVTSKATQEADWYPKVTGSEIALRQAQAANQSATARETGYKLNHPYLYAPGSAAANIGLLQELQRNAQGQAAPRQQSTNQNYGVSDEIPRLLEKNGQKGMPAVPNGPGNNINGENEMAPMSEGLGNGEISEDAIQKIINAELQKAGMSPTELAQLEITKRNAEIQNTKKAEYEKEQQVKLAEDIEKSSMASYTAQKQNRLIDRAREAYLASRAKGGGITGGIVPSEGIVPAALTSSPRIGNGNKFSGYEFGPEIAFDNAMNQIINDTTQSIGRGEVTEKQIDLAKSMKAFRQMPESVMLHKLDEMQAENNRTSEKPKFQLAASRLNLKEPLDRPEIEALYQQAYMDRPPTGNKAGEVNDFYNGTLSDYLKPDVVEAFRAGKDLPVVNQKQVISWAKKASVTPKIAFTYLRDREQK